MNPHARSRLSLRFDASLVVGENNLRSQKAWRRWRALPERAEAPGRDGSVRKNLVFELTR